MINIEEAVFTEEDGIKHIHIEDLLQQLEVDFNCHFEVLFADGDVAHLHKAEAIKGIADWATEQCDYDDWDIDDDIRRMKDYLVVAGHLDSPVTPKPRKRDSCGEVKL